MIQILLVTFIITLFYIGIANRLNTYLNILAFQGVLLFLMTYLQLQEVHWLNLLIILLETIVVKAIVIPMFLKYIIKRNHITREAEPYLSNFASLLIITSIVGITFYISGKVGQEFINMPYFTVAVSTLFTGMYIIISRKKIVTHVIGYLLIENGVFIMSLSIGNEMPMMVNMGVLFDVFVSVLILGIFVNKIGDVFKDDASANVLSQLRD